MCRSGIPAPAGKLLRRLSCVSIRPLEGGASQEPELYGCMKVQPERHLLGQIAVLAGNICPFDALIHAATDVVGQCVLAWSQRRGFKPVDQSN